MAGIVVLHGSEGGGPGYHAAMAELLAQNGYAALAFTWCASTDFPVVGVPPDAIDVDIENTVQAIRWLQGCPEMNGKKTGLYGVSRGAELALLLASMQQNQLLPSLDAIAVHASSDRVMPGFGRGLIHRDSFQRARLSDGTVNPWRLFNKSKWKTSPDRSFSATALKTVSMARVGTCNGARRLKQD